MRKHIFISAVAVVALAGLAIPASADAKNGGHVRKVRLQDRCEPVSFNVFGNAHGLGDVCSPHNGELITFDEFFAALNPVTHRGIDKWNIHPDMIEIKMGDSLSVSVRGGEGHTFTEVPGGFGPDGVIPGCVDLLNGPLGLTGDIPADCGTQLAPVFAGGTLTAPGLPPVIVSNLSEGPHFFMCYIHPWMQAEVDVRG